MSVIVPDHGCNAWCRPADGRHCDLVYTTTTHPEATRRHITAAYLRRYGVQVTQVQPAREAPPLAAQNPAGLHLVEGARHADRACWLVWWSVSVEDAR